MKRTLRNILFPALLTIAAFTITTYTSCTRDECKGVMCINRGTCAGGVCSCPTGYEGANCETLSAAKFAGSFRTTTEACSISGSKAQYDITIATSTTDARTILISNLYNANTISTGTITGNNTFNIDSQLFGSSGTITGSGIANGAQLTISYTVTVGGTTDACNGVVYFRQ